MEVKSLYAVLKYINNDIKAIIIGNTIYTNNAYELENFIRTTVNFDRLRDNKFVDYFGKDIMRLLHRKREIYDLNDILNINYKDIPVISWKNDFNTKYAKIYLK